ncbi:ribonuclease domain-containing protein [Rosenbergiella collisarenosi]|uniref:ribonuclease domain-containing protein n=1 Tax=Rosenbergiella collisarenosi TaxID=1544695 RepID=UPI001F4FFE01|nr:ribonuclease domain-containing protein [Rosenbergiella collisarenosi]
MQLKKLRPVIILALLLIGYALKVWHSPVASPSSPTQHSSSSSRASSEANSDPLAVARYIQAHQRLPDFYIRKGEARRSGWIASKGNLCDVLPGRVIGGDRFSNREHSLPDSAGRHWQEADVNFSCGRRNSDRLLYSSDGLIYLTTDHYRSFKQVP